MAQLWLGWSVVLSRKLQAPAEYTSVEDWDQPCDLSILSRRFCATSGALPGRETVSMYARGSDTMLRSPGRIGMLCSPFGSQTPILCNGKLPGDCQIWKFAPLSTISPPSKEAIS